MSIRVLIAALIIAIGIQNTCPHGWAAKTAFLSSHVTHCGPMKEHKNSDTDSRDHSRKGSCHVNQTFVFHVSTPETTSQNTASVHTAIPYVTDPLLEVFSDPLLKPPPFALFV
jgi:predicted histidine transporter YuiF (NhaC family)